ncbi:cupin domain-containing protein [Frankia sp. CNm7]|uniref:Cupin domain-containing protein n=1 Tax=Frankia nepalensis TaxID=1836974 RepID=A0A937URU9_9ACTN|nr:cupin domain-containing protein [Frankia nepalensis]MBL7500637.1 cupin domain-containing protein [Frankia nepalensis]MBL7511402.1 cupin domain-containing protein [Frankia nepalensis]MBL7521765.1 cupin domain-containing protein [Frankia nepalensis]MBL7631498.1 cupin domain-containing protein [Frankia nepalensis]
MTAGLVRPGAGTLITYASSPLEILAGGDGEGSWAAATIEIPAFFRGPVPHVHDTFDEALFVVSGTLLVTTGTADPEEAPAGSFINAPRGTRHTFSNPTDTPVRVLGLWSPPREGLDFMRAVGAVLPAAGAPDPDAVRAVYEAHHSRLVP